MPRSNWRAYILARMLHRRCFIGMLTAGGLAGPLWRAARATAQSSGGVTVNHEAPVVTRQQFDWQQPPRDMPKLTPPEAGVCDTTFAINMTVGFSLDAVAPRVVELWVERLEITTRLTIDIYTLAGGPSKLVAHEEGHREISEHYYRNSAVAVHAVARPLIGKMFRGTGLTRNAAQQDAMNKITAALEDGYMTRTRLRAGAANERFDEITQHGLNSIDEADAIAMAIGVDP